MDNVQVSRIKSKNDDKLLRKLIYITINSNVSSGCIPQEDYEQFKNDFDIMIENFYNCIGQFIRLRPNKNAIKLGILNNNSSRKDLEKYVQNVSASYVMEQGPITKMYHSHGLIVLRLRYMVADIYLQQVRTYLNDWISEYMERLTGVKGHKVYLNVKRPNDNAGNIHEYMAKNPIE